MAIATIVSITGQAWARDSQGNLRELQEGDTLEEGETLVTSDNGSVQLDMGDAFGPTTIDGGEVVSLSPEMDASVPASVDESSVSDDDLQTMLTALEQESGDLLQYLEDPAAGGAGAGGGQGGGGHDFVRIARITEQVGSLTFDLDGFQLDGQADVSTTSFQGNAETAEDDDSVLQTVADNATTDEDTPVTTDVLGNDSFEGSPTVSAVTQGANGAVSIDGNGQVTYTPNDDFHGSDSYTYTVTSGGVTETATVNVTVNPVDDLASFGGDTSGSGAEDTTLTGTLTVSDNADGMATPNFSIASDGAPTNGTASIDPVSGEWTYTPNADYNGDDSFTVSVTDDDGNTETQVIDVTVNPVADIVADSATTAEDTAVTSDVLSNDTFESPDAEVTAVTQGTNGNVSVNADGTVTYTPNDDFHGSDSYTYTVTSGGVTETATVNVTVDPVDDGVADSFTTNEDTPLSDDVSANDTHSAAATYSLNTDASNGTVAMSNDGIFTYTPNADYNGADSFSYDVEDVNGDTETVTVDLTVEPVNDAPIATDLSDRSSDDSETISFDVSGNFSDVDSGDSLTFSANGLPPGLMIDPSTGVISGVLDSSASQGGDAGTYQVTISASDGNGGSVAQNFEWTVSNPAPDAQNDSATTDEDSYLSVPSDGVFSNDIDPDGDSLGLIEVNDDTSSLSAAVSGDNGGTFIIRADGSYDFDPGSDFQQLDQGESATTSVSYTVDDGEGGKDTATLTMTVTGITDDAPTVEIGDNAAGGADHSV
ncbi:retention module-containing protein, partial [Halomonas sabkhae]|uniref:retention module-containing protein n=1 Tax=Halomonas sabkhae TaxID=626223 RepID=UPI0025B37905